MKKIEGNSNVVKLVIFVKFYIIYKIEIAFSCWKIASYGCLSHLMLQNSGLYYKPMMIINDDSRVVTKLETSLTDDARVVIYDCHMFIVQATGVQNLYTFSGVTSTLYENSNIMLLNTELKTE
jgi:hypothetical protein